MNHALHYCLDTDMCIYLLNGHPRVKTRVAEVGVTALAVAIPTVGELYFGAYNSGRVEANIARVRAFLSPPGPQVLLIDESAAEQFGRFKTLLRRAGRPIGDIDLFIAGVAVRHGLTVTFKITCRFFTFICREPF